MKMLLRMLPYFLIIALSSGFLSYTVVRNQQAVRDATRALCALRQGYTDQARQAHAFLKTHPNGAPSLGFTAAQIRQQEAKARAQARALNDVSCGSSMNHAT